MTKQFFDVNNPANQQIIAQVPNMTAADALRAVDQAHAALPAWKARTGKDRAQLLRRWFDLMNRDADRLARLMTEEQGKALMEAKGEVNYAASFIEWFAEEAKRVMGAIPASPWSDKRMMVLKQAIGVCVSITPWNFPLAMITRKVAPAIAAGCTIVIKPAEQTPLSALALVELAKEAGIPDGVINLVTADGKNSIEIGKALCDSPLVRHLSFTGSTPVGRILMEQCAPTIKKVALELGGHAPFIVFEDADLDAAVSGAMQSKYRNAGQTCVCTNRFYVHESLHDAFVEKLTQASKGLVIGPGLDKGVQLGPLIDQQAIDKVEQHVQDAVAKGARLMTGGKRHALGSTFYEPTVLAGVKKGMLITEEETFGPVAAVIPFTLESEVIQMANDSEFGLASYFYSKDISRIWRVAEALEFGMVGVNTGTISSEVGPFGGVKQSGLGREGSVWGMDEYLEMKYVCLGL
ncbi:NAD-dependent succinate-semialdehyde dehydrogenase [Polynucleobacter cosmopolitanus]|uniref:Succinate-semialdehyde dehydrogenase (NADP(+)) n=1 Tax=Polynucleobacter cosmopolitanus TaxID=351345 RepID=A0A229FW65_9BURK|nr:NAD-dependent succinate-semialdehyde dehydrogenase [Polynucleobacter cosmopolitanus]OXL16225.1 succinate-semialdehyde dehydrogenase (NADP(+)) [Polynucleobacter cosmopolitanus]